MSERIDFRAPKRHKEMIKSIARNKGVKEADIYREALEQYLSSYTKIPTVKQLDEQVQRHETAITEMKKALVKKGIME